MDSGRRMKPQGATLLAYCRAGFEGDLAAEMRSLGIARVDMAQGHVLAQCAPASLGRTLAHPWTFARAALHAAPEAIALAGNDRVTPIAHAARSWLDSAGIAAVNGVRIEYPDTNEGKAASRLVDILEPRLVDALGDRIVPGGASEPRLHVFLTPDRQARVAVSPAGTVPWRNGIPRLRMPAAAPSRSTLKLAEAFAVFLGDHLDRAVRPDMRAVDLGAAPGGWTWQFVERGVRVTAIDNGPLKGDLVDNAMVKHLRMDGFRYQPRQPVDWMVCDMVEKPSRVAQLVAQWMGHQWCSASIFNLKLPMKKRFEEVEKCRAVISSAAEEVGRRYEVRIRQLYHDREEVTGLVRFLPRISHGKKGRSAANG